MSKELNASYESQLYSIIYKHIPLSLFASFINSGMVVLILLPKIDHNRLFLWLGFSVGLVVVRFPLYLYTRKNKTAPVNKVLFAVGVFFSGFLLGAPAIFLFPDEIHLQVLVVFVQGGMTVGSLVVYSMKKFLFFLYSIPVFFPMIIRFYLIGDYNHIVMASLLLFFYVALVNALIYQNRSIKEIFFLKEQLELISFKDPLTDLRNRRFLNQVILPEIAAFEKRISFQVSHDERRIVQSDQAHIYGIIMIDVDYFKKINDSYGHKAGDEFLRQFTAILTENTRSDDVVLRMGGEEFLIILRNTVRDFLPRFAGIIRMAVETTCFVVPGDITFFKTCSIGYTGFPVVDRAPELVSFDHAVSLADHALYYAKNSGRNKTVGIGNLDTECIKSDIVHTLIEDFNGCVDKGVISLIE